MATAFLVLLLAGAQPYQGPTKAQLLGATPEAILRGGRKAWAKKWQNANPPSTPGLEKEEALWGRVRTAVNDQQIRRLPLEKQEAFRVLREKMAALYEDAIPVGQVITSGGSVWVTVSRAGTAAGEEIISRILTGRPPKSPANPKSDLAAFRRFLDDCKPTITRIETRRGTYYEALRRFPRLGLLSEEVVKAGRAVSPLGAAHAACFPGLVFSWIKDNIEQGDPAWWTRTW